MRPILPPHACLLSAAVLLSACASSERRIETTGAGAIAGCATGLLVAFVVKGNPMHACLGGAVVGGAVGYEKARREELAQARREADAMAGQQGVAETPVVQTQEVQVVDAETGQAQQVQAFRGMTVDLPLSQIDTPEGREVMRKLTLYARKLAEERAEPIHFNVATPGGERKLLDESAEAAGKGWVIRRALIDTDLPSTVQRVSIETRNPASFLASR